MGLPKEIISDVVETAAFETETWLNLRDEISSKFLRPRPTFDTWNSRPRLEISKFCALCWNFLKISSPLPSWIFFQISGFFPSCFGCFLPANTTNKKSSNYRKFAIPFLCNIQSLDTTSLRDRDEIWNVRDRDEIWNLRDQDSQKWVSRLVSRPRPSVETPSLEIIFPLQKNWCLEK